jgi:hypothetical protein
VKGRLDWSTKRSFVVAPALLVRSLKLLEALSGILSSLPVSRYF